MCPRWVLGEMNSLARGLWLLMAAKPSSPIAGSVALGDSLNLSECPLPLIPLKTCLLGSRELFPSGPGSRLDGGREVQAC